MSTALSTKKFGLILDLDDTLTNETESWRNSVRQTCELAINWFSLPRDITVERLLFTYKEVSDRLWSQYDALHGLESNSLRRQFVWAAALRELRIIVTPADLALLVHRYEQIRCDTLTTRPGIVAGLHRLRHRVFLAICTNGDSPTQVDKLRNLGILDLFDVVVCGRDFGVQKPNSELFLRCVDKLGLPVSDCWYAGDDWEADVLGAASVGMRVAWISSDCPPAPVPHLLTQYPSLLDFFGRLEQDLNSERVYDGLDQHWAEMKD